MSSGLVPAAGSAQEGGLLKPAACYAALQSVSLCKQVLSGAPASSACTNLVVNCELRSASIGNASAQDAQ